MKSELESYGISTKSFLEKSELVDALQKARDDGLTPKQQKPQTTTTTTTTSSSTSASSSSSTGSSTPTANRSEKIEDELKKIESLSAKEMKKELESLGVSTKSFFEKREFAQALAEARVDGVTAKSSSSSNGGEGFASYADVEVLPADGPGPRAKQSGQEAQSQGRGGGSPFGGGASPFGGGAGGASPFGGGAGMGGMGGIADMLKNMGGMGGGGAPNMADMFSNMGGMGGMGDMFGGAGGMGGAAQKAQQMMQNPKVREIIGKAQSNPKIMRAVQECMSNPAAFAKYQNDPEVGELVNELRKYM